MPLNKRGLIFITQRVLYTNIMSVDKRRLDDEAQSDYRNLTTSDSKGLFSRLNRHFEVWSRLYVEQRVDALTGRN